MQGLESLQEALKQIAVEKEQQEAALEEEDNPEKPRKVIAEKPFVSKLDTESHLSEIEMLTKKAEMQRKASSRKIKKEDHSKGYYDKLSAKEKFRKQAMQKHSKAKVQKKK